MLKTRDLAIQDAQKALAALRSGNAFYTPVSLSNAMRSSLTPLIPEDIETTSEEIAALTKSWAVNNAKRVLASMRMGDMSCSPTYFTNTMRDNGVVLIPEDIGTTSEEIAAIIKAWVITRAKSILDSLRAGVRTCSPYGLTHTMTSLGVVLSPEDIGTDEAELAALAQQHASRTAAV